jgi:uncharacterized protein
MAFAAAVATSIADWGSAGARAGRTFGLALACLCLWAMPVLAEPAYPELQGRVTDQAGLLSASDKADLESDLASLEQTSTDQLAVVTVNSLNGYTIEDYGVGLGRKWGIGQKGKDNGVLLIIAPNDRKVRIEVGRRLEPMMTDTMSSLIIQNAILPKFRRGDFAGGIKDGVRDIKTVLLGDAEEVKRRAQGARSPQDDPTVMIHLILFLLIVAFIIWVNYRNTQTMTSGVPGSRRRGGVIVVPGGSGNWGGGWSSGSSGDSGGGWSGGGGDFGGGGASGSW